MNKILILIISILALPFIFYFGLLFIAHDGNIHFLQIDNCLDKGGKWNYKTNECEYFDIVYKDWHISPLNSKISSDIYPFVKWQDVKRLRIGMNEENLISIIKFIQDYHHKVNAIIYTISPDSISYEVAIKLSENKKVTDISFKELNF